MPYLPINTSLKNQFRNYVILNSRLDQLEWILYFVIRKTENLSFGSLEIY